jgi:hypothetical protein
MRQSTGSLLKHRRMLHVIFALSEMGIVCVGPGYCNLPWLPRVTGNCESVCKTVVLLPPSCSGQQITANKGVKTFLGESFWSDPDQTLRTTFTWPPKPTYNLISCDGAGMLCLDNAARHFSSVGLLSWSTHVCNVAVTTGAVDICAILDGAETLLFTTVSFGMTVRSYCI